MNEKEIQRLLSEMDTIEVPKDKLAKARQAGYSKYKKRDNRNATIYKQLAIVTILIIVFVTSIRISPAFAQSVAKIPGFAPLVELITADKGVKDIVENEYYEELGIVQTKNNLTLTILGTIADESGMIIFYQLEAPYDISKLDTTEFDLTQNGENLQASSMYSWYAEEPTNIIKDKFEVVASEVIDYSNPNFELNVTFDDEEDTSFNVPFTLSKPIQQSKIIEQNKVVVVDGQKIIIEFIKISPLRAEIKLSVDEENTMQILNIDRIKLLDENGEEWGRPSNGLISFGGFRDESISLFIQSNYFRKPEKLTLILDEIEALPKGEDYVVVDFLKQKVLKNPLENEIDIKVGGFNWIDVTYTDHSEMKGQLFSKVLDANGNIYYSNSHSISTIEQRQEATYSFDLKDALNPVKLYFNSYPSFLNGSAEIEIPIQ
nr:DUF4179 domain-containing protein [Lysinibacillus timonensis]